MGIILKRSPHLSNFTHCSTLGTFHKNLCSASLASTRRFNSVESLDPISGDKIRVTVTPGGVQKVEPEAAVVSWVNSNVDPSNIRGSICHYVYFFSSPETASKWIAEHPGKMFYPVIDAFRAAKKIHNRYNEMQTDACC